MSIDYDPFSDAVRANPFAYYRRLRDEAPLHWSERTKTWVVSRYEDVRYVLSHPELFSSDAMATAMLGIAPGVDFTKDPEAMERVAGFAENMPVQLGNGGRNATLITADPPDHDRLRLIVNRGFTPRRIADWAPRVERIVAELLEELSGKARFDLVRDFAVPLPMTVIAEMLGVERQHHQQFKQWSDGVISGATGSGRAAGVRSGGLAVAMGSLAQYIVKIAEERRETPRDDLISVLVRRQAEDDEVLTPAEMVLLATVLLVAGNETTTNLIGSATKLLLEHPEQLAQLRDDPTLVPGLVEEVLRFEAPVQFVFRRSTREVDVAGGTIPANSTVTAVIGAANRDERQFANADCFDLARGGQGHLAFGFGVHFCLGASLARLEARLALEGLIPHLPSLQRSSAPVRYVDSYLMRGPRVLELERVAA